MRALLDIDDAEILFDGTFTEPRLRHPEGIAVDAHGDVWCGGETGEIYRIAADGSGIEAVASTDGFVLGIAFDRAGRLYCCDLKHAAVFRLDPATGRLEEFADGADGERMRIPNFPVVDEGRGVLYVSDSFDPDEPGPGVWRFSLDTGEGGWWYREPMTFANGMALAPDGDGLYVIESFAQRVVRIPIRADGGPGEPEVVATDLETVPDGVAIDRDGRLYVSCYEPSRIYRVDEDGAVEVLIDDPEAHTLCHPTNCAFRGDELLTANLGRWHVTRVPVGVSGHPLLPGG